MALDNSINYSPSIIWKGKIPSLMADMAKGIKSFKSNMAEDEKPTNPDQDNPDNQNKDQ